jgi:hypothetical protein
VISRAATIAEDATLLGPWASAFDALCGAAVRREPLDATDPSAGQRLIFPRVFERIELIGGNGHFRHHAAMRAQAQRMGFDWDADGCVLTVPAPGAFNARLQRVGFPHSGVSVCYANGAAAALALGPWLLRYMGGMMTVLVNGPEFYTSLLSPRTPPHQRDDARWGLLSLAHDLSVHALNYHLIPHAALIDLADRIRTAVPERHAAWSDADATAPLTLTYFYDNDFNRYTYAVWCRCEQPRDFAAIFTAPRNYDQLVAALDVRLAETRAGRGDVASGDFDDMRPLAETRFTVE